LVTSSAIGRSLDPAPASAQLIEKYARDETGVFLDEAIPLVHGEGANSEAIRRSAGGQFAAADLTDDGRVTFSLQGRSPQNEEGVEKVCAILIERFNQHGDRWSDPTRSTEPGVDCEARDESRLLKVQVTRTPYDPAIRRALGRTGVSSGAHASADEAADDLRARVEAKADRAAPSGRIGITLALDATDTSAYVLQEVVRSFRARHGTWVRNLGFEAVWVVGPTSNLTHRLDGSPR